MLIRVTRSLLSIALATIGTVTICPLLSTSGEARAATPAAARARPPKDAAADLIAGWEWGGDPAAHRAEAGRILAASGLVSRAVSRAGAASFDAYVKMVAGRGASEAEVIRVAAWSAAVEYHFNQQVAKKGQGNHDCQSLAGAFSGVPGLTTGMPTKSTPAPSAPSPRGGGAVSAVPLCGGGGAGGASSGGDIPSACLPGAGTLGMCGLPSTGRLGNVPGFGGTSAVSAAPGSTVDPESARAPGPQWKVQDACTALNPKAFMGGAALTTGSPPPSTNPGGGSTSTPPTKPDKPEPAPSPSPVPEREPGREKAPPSAPSPEPVQFPSSRGRPTEDGAVGAVADGCRRDVVQAMFGCMFPSVGAGATAAGDRLKCTPGNASMSPGMPAPETALACSCGGFGGGATKPGPATSFSPKNLGEICAQFGGTQRWAQHCGAYDPSPTTNLTAPRTMPASQGGAMQQPSQPLQPRKTY